eukprot:355550-Chlamydomonas_euryale.AAC.1
MAATAPQQPPLLGPGPGSWAHLLSHAEAGCLLLSRGGPEMSFFEQSVVLITSHDDAKVCVGVGEGGRSGRGVGVGCGLACACRLRLSCPLAAFQLPLASQMPLGVILGVGACLPAPISSRLPL